MNRQPMDLLDLFRNPGASASKKGARATSRPVREPGSNRREQGPGFGGSGRQRMLAGSAVALLLALSFVAGVGVGRARRGPASPALASPAKQVTRWSLRSRALPRMSIAAGQLDRVAATALATRFPELAGIILVGPAENAKGVVKDRFVLTLEGFTDKAAADAWRQTLAAWEVDGQIPFAGAVPYPKP